MASCLKDIFQSLNLWKNSTNFKKLELIKIYKIKPNLYHWFTTIHLVPSTCKIVCSALSTRRWSVQAWSLRPVMLSALVKPSRRQTERTVRGKGEKPHGSQRATTSVNGPACHAGIPRNSIHRRKLHLSANALLHWKYTRTTLKVGGS